MTCGRMTSIWRKRNGADKGNSLRIFVRAGAFAYKHEARVGWPVGEDDLVAAFVKRAAGTVANVFADKLKRGGAVGGLDDRENLRRSEDGLAGGDEWVLLG